MNTAEQIIVDFVCERGPHNPPALEEIANRVPITAIIGGIVERMVEAGEIEQFKDDERGTVYTRDC